MTREKESKEKESKSVFLDAKAAAAVEFSLNYAARQGHVMETYRLVKAGSILIVRES